MTVRLGRGDDIYELLKVSSLNGLLGESSNAVETLETAVNIGCPHGASGADVWLPARWTDSGGASSPHSASGADILIPALWSERGAGISTHAASGADVFKHSTIVTGSASSPHGASGADVFYDASDVVYLVYSALLTQSGTNAPVATVLQNTLGYTVTWARSGAGQYSATLVGSSFPANTFILTTATRGIGVAGVTYTYGVVNSGTNAIDFVSAYLAVGPPVSISQQDGILTNAPIEIRIYL